LDRPVHIGCGHFHCRSCFTLWLLQSADCPTCREPKRLNETYAPTPTILINIIQSLQLACRFADRGCEHTDALSAIASHEQACQFRPEHCSFRCGKSFNARDRQDHEMTCERGDWTLLRTLVCYQCNLALKDGRRPTHCDYYHLCLRDPKERPEPPAAPGDASDSEEPPPGDDAPIELW
jgi:hypothetical protein